MTTTFNARCAGVEQVLATTLARGDVFVMDYQLGHERISIRKATAIIGRVIQTKQPPANPGRFVVLCDGHPIGLAEAIIIESLGHILCDAGFLPSGAGMPTTVLTAAAALFGVPHAIALSAALVRGSWRPWACLGCWLGAARKPSLHHPHQPWESPRDSTLVSTQGLSGARAAGRPRHRECVRDQCLQRHLRLLQFRPWQGLRRRSRLDGQRALRRGHAADA